MTTLALPPRPSVLPPRPEGIPDELKEMPTWCLWKLEIRQDKDGTFKWTKCPYQVSGIRASSVDPTTWTSFQNAIGTYNRLASWLGKPGCKIGFDGVGFVFTSGIVGVDIDRCLTEGVFEPWAQEIVEQLQTYTEISPSGTGAKLWCRGELPTSKTGQRKGPIEIYSRGRYFTATGHHWPGTPREVREANGELTALWQRVFGDAAKPKAKSKKRRSAQAVMSEAYQPTDEDVLRKAGKARNSEKFHALMSGDTTGYASPSEADGALAQILAFWSQDVAQIERVMRQSDLNRDKWDEPRGGSTWIRETISTAIDRANERYEWRKTPSGDPSTFPLTDSGNAERFAEQHGANVRYCWPREKWLTWDGKRWPVDDRGAVEQLGKQTARSILQEAVEEVDPDRRDAIAHHAIASESASRRASMLKLARSEPGIPVLPNELDQNDWLLTLPNGTLDLKSGRLREHRREDLITKLCPTPYDPLATCPLWLAFLQRIFDGRDALIRFVQRLLGYSLTGDVSAQVLPIFHGQGANGKSTLLNVFMEMLGEDYTMKAVPDMLMSKRQQTHSTDRADLFGKRFVAAIETNEDRRLDEALAKDLTGGDRQRARRCYEDNIEFRPTHKIVLAANHRPIIGGSDIAIWRRVKLVPFSVVIPPAERDGQLLHKLREEFAGILNWCIEGCLDWQQNGLGEPEEVSAATNSYQNDEDTLGKFLSECCTLEANAHAKLTDLVQVYHEWAGDKGMTPKKLSKKLKEREFDFYTSNGTWFRGVGLPVESRRTEGNGRTEGN